MWRSEVPLQLTTNGSSGVAGVDESQRRDPVPIVLIGGFWSLVQYLQADDGWG